MSSALLIANRIALPSEAPKRIKIHPWGLAKSVKGESLVDEESVRLILEAFEAHGVDLPIDYEHHTVGGEFSSPDGKALAAGWIKRIESVQDDGLYADVEWTAKGAEHVTSKEYRYLSPVILVRKSDRRVLKLHSVALTNKPAIVGMEPIVNRDKVMALSEETWERARWFLNLPTTATEKEIMDQFEKLLAQLRELAGASATTDQQGIIAALKEKLKAPAPSTLRPELCKTLALKDDVTDEAIVKATADAVTKAQAAVPAPAEMTVLSERVTKAEARAQAAEDRLIAREAEERIAAALSAGKLTQADLDHSQSGPYFKGLARDPVAWAACIDRLPGKAPPNGRHGSSSAAPAAAGGAHGGDAILANSDRFDSARMPKYEEARKYQRENKCTFNEACTAVGA